MLNITVVNTGAIATAAPRVVNVIYVWPCFNCHEATPVDANVHKLLKRGILTGVGCGDCLQPPTPGILLRAVA